MKFLILCSVICFLGFTVQAQELPIMGSLADIGNRSKVYIIADAVHSKAMRKEIEKQKTLKIVSDPKGAEFFIEYKILDQKDGVTGMNLTIETGQVDVYFSNANRKTIAWQESSSNSMKYPSIVLIKRFLKEFKRARSE